MGSLFTDSRRLLAIPVAFLVFVPRPVSAQVPVDALVTMENRKAIDDQSTKTAGQPATPETDPIRQGPKPLVAGKVGVGNKVPNLTFTDIDGVTRSLNDYRDRKAIVVALTGTGCPLCLKYAPSLAEIEESYRGRGVEFVFVNPNESESEDRWRKAITTHGFRGPYVSDGTMEIPRTLGAKTTTEVFVIDSSRELVYRGAVDDQYGFGYALDQPDRTFLTDALDAVLASETVSVAATTSPGCELYYGDRATRQPDSQVTYHREIARIIQANCIECHRGGGIAPIPFETYEDVRDYAGMIRSVVERKIMPPWFAAPSHDTESSGAPRWANERTLSETEKSDLFAWIDQGVPEGNPDDAPPPKTFPDGWLIGQPDVVFEFDQPVPVKATGTMPYQNVTVETDLPEGKWVQAIEVRPGQPSVVHHVIVSLRGNGEAVDERDGFWGVYVPGNSTLVYPEGFAKFLPKGVKLRFQMHYTPNGTATEDRTRIGLIFADQPPKHEVKVKGIANGRINIPAGADNHREVEDLPLPHDVKVLGFLPHMHLRGKAARYEVITSDGVETLLDIPHYDFNWQLLYRLAEPQTLKAGDTIRFTAWYDNSEENPANPDPSKVVRWGPQTEDEMHLGYVEYFVPGVDPDERTGSSATPDRRGGRRALFDTGLFARLDRNRDGWVTREEVRQTLPGNDAAAGPIFDRLDTNRDDRLNRKEISLLRKQDR